MSSSSNYFEIASFFNKEIEKMAEIQVRISSFGKIYSVEGEGFWAQIEAEELQQLCPNKRITGKVIETRGQSPIFTGETVQVIFLEKGRTKIRINISSMTPEVLVKRFFRPGEIAEAERVIKKRNFILRWSVLFVAIGMVLISIIGGILDSWKPLLVGLTLAGAVFIYDNILKNQLKQVID